MIRRLVFLTEEEILESECGSPKKAEIFRLKKNQALGKLCQYLKELESKK